MTESQTVMLCTPGMLAVPTEDVSAIGTQLGLLCLLRT
ncbi:rCG62095 [Rattus norvegicus]|uniref:RCG62095 n=1 Tax=Rattus norvegicus TaxID=10116 RepID=A6HBX8_RAT|nr:rCG62095 [Rattus norvegicus]